MAEAMKMFLGLFRGMTSSTLSFSVA